MRGENEDIQLLQPIEFEFTEDMNLSSIESDLEDEGFSMVVDNRTLTMIPTEPMDPGRTYLFSIEGCDPAGNSLEENEFNFTVTDKGRLMMYLISNETGYRINAHIYLNRTDGSLDIYHYFSSYTEFLPMGEWHLLVTKEGFHSYEIRFSLEAGENVDLGNITLFSIPGHDTGPVDDDDDDVPGDDDGDDDREEGNDEGDSEVPYSLILIVLLIILGLIFIVTLARRGRYEELIQDDTRSPIGSPEE
jgi:hypothetical protein